MTVTDEKNTPPSVNSDSANTEVLHADTLGASGSRQHNAENSSSQSSTASKTSAAKPSSGSNWGVWLVLIILIAVLAAGAWLSLPHYRNLQQSLTSLQTELEQQRQANEAQRQDMAADLEHQLRQQDENIQAVLNDLAQRLDSTAARVLAMSSLNRDDWKLAEAEYLLRLANQRVLLERNSGNAVALAEAVDDILRNINDVDLFPVRKALASEMSELTLAGDIDREGVYLRILALSEQIEKLPLIEPLGTTEEIWPEDEPAVDEGIWVKVKRGMLAVLRKFSHHLRVRDHAQPVPAILPPDNQIYLKQNMRLMFEQAQAALLREEAQVYQASLEKAQTWLKLYFPLNNQSVAAQAEIAELQSVIITQSLPNFSESTALLKTYMERRQKLAVSRRGGK